MSREPIFLIHDVARMMRTRFDQWARGYGLTRAQGVILFRLARQPGLSQNEMASLLEVEPITVGRLVDRLEARGMVERRADPSDRRVKRLHLLPAAEPMVAHIDAYTEELAGFLFGELDPKLRQGLEKALLHIKNKLAAEAEVPARAVAGE
jgi:DNA-binding MarR family transcriptional regulator